MWVGRIIVGLYFVRAGIMHLVKLDAMTGYAASKGLPFPKAATALSGVFLLLLPGLGVLFGNLAIVAQSFGALIIFLLLAAFTMHAFWKEKDMARMADEVNFYKNVAFAGALMIALVGWLL